MGARQSRPNAAANALAKKKAAAAAAAEKKEKQEQYRVTMAPIFLRDKEKEKLSFQNIQQEVDNLFSIPEKKEEKKEEDEKPPVLINRRQIQPFSPPPLPAIPIPEKLLRRSICPKPPMENYNFIVCLISALVFTDDCNKNKIDAERVKKIIEEKKKKQDYLFDQVNQGNQVYTELQDRKNNLYSKLANFKPITSAKKKEEIKKEEIKEEIIKETEETEEINEEIKEEIKKEEINEEIIKHRDSPSPDATRLLRIPHLDIDDDESVIDDDTESIRSNMIRVEFTQKKARGSRKNKLAFGNITESEDRLFIETNQPQAQAATSTVAAVKIEDIVEFLIKKENEQNEPDKFKEYMEKIHSWNDSIWLSLTSSVLKKMASRFGVKPKGTKQELKKLILEKTSSI